MSRVDRSSDEGAILVLVLAFLAVFGLVVMALLGQSDVSLRNTGVVTDFGKKVYSADGAVDFGIEALQTDSALCANPADGTDTDGDGAGEELITDQLLVDGDVKKVRVTCETTSGSSTGVGGYAVLTTSAGASSFKTSNGAEKTVRGPVHVSGQLDLGKPLIVERGGVTHTGSDCLPASAIGTVGPPSILLEINPSPPYRYRCSPGGTNPVVKAPLPARPTGPAQSPTGTPVGGCTVFEPGIYTSQPVLGRNNYFKSGVYAFKDIGTWPIQQPPAGGGGPKDASIVGGEGGTGTGAETRVLSEIPCFAESAPSGLGVLFVLEGSSAMQLVNKSSVELFSRRTAVTDDPGISIQVPVDSDVANGWTPRPAGFTVPALDSTTGSEPKLAVHGAVVAPTAPVKIFATNGTIAQLLNGVVASTLELQSSASANGLGVSVPNTAGKRHTVVTATVAGSQPGERQVVANAVIDVSNDATRTVTVLSRRGE